MEGGDFVKWVIKDTLDSCQDDLVLFFQFVDKTLEERLRFVVERPFHRVSTRRRFTFYITQGGNGNSP